jgi:hypothetical protein
MHRISQLFKLLKTKLCLMELGDMLILVYEEMELGYHNQYSYDATGWMIQSANPSRCKKFFSSLKRKAQTSSGACPGLQFNVCWVLLWGSSGQCV